MPQQSSAVITPNLGLYLGRSPLAVPSRALQDGFNFRIKQGFIENLTMGWSKFFPTGQVLNGPCMLIETFSIRGTAEIQVFASLTDLYRFDEVEEKLYFITPIYNVGTVDVSADTDAVVSVDSGTPNWVTNDIHVGDQIAFGADDENDPDATWYTIKAVDGESQLTIDGAVAGAPLSAQNYTIRRLFTGAVDEPWDTEIFVQPDDGTGDDLLFVTNGSDPIVTWDGTADFAIQQTDLGFTCKRLAVYRNMMIYANVLTFAGLLLPSSFINSDVGKPLEVVTGLAGQFRVHGGVDQIHELEDLGDNLVFYAERHIVLTQFVGDPLVFVFREAAQGIGPIASRLVADFGDYHVFIGTDSQYLFDGVAVTEVGKQVWREVLRTRDASRHQLGFTHFDEENGELHWVVALTSDAGVGDPNTNPEKSYTDHYLEDVGERTPTPISSRSIPFLCSGYGSTRGVLTWDQLTDPWEDLTMRWNDSSFFSAFPTNLFGGIDGHVYVLNVSQTGDGVDLPSFVTFGRRPLGDSKMRGLLTRVYPYATQLTGDLTITARFADHEGGTVTKTHTVAFDQTLPEGGHFAVFYRRARYFSLKFSTPGHGWRLEGYDVDIRPGGYR